VAPAPAYRADSPMSIFAGPLRSARSTGPGVSVAVVAPGAGTGFNRSAYTALERRSGLNVTIKGHSHAPYDCYPQTWNSGHPAPNLETFAMDLIQEGIMEQNQCLVLGSRGGQVVLPALWAARGNSVPPSVVINGGCARDDLPAVPAWPDQAVTFLLIGGKDYFRGQLKIDEYLNSTMRNVPRQNTTTAILLVNDMVHMPQTSMLDSILRHLIMAAVSWKASSVPPQEEFNSIVNVLHKTNWSGRLVYKTSENSWDDITFSSHQGIAYDEIVL